MKFRAAVLGSVLILTPTVAIADSTDGTAVIDLLEAAQAPEQPTMTPPQLRNALESDSSDDSKAGAYRLLTQPLEADEFFVAGVTWDGAEPETVEIRTLEQGAWGDWYSLEIEAGDGGNEGTEPYIAGGAEGVQVRVTGDALPAELNLALSNGEGGDSPATALPGEAALAPEPGTEFAEAVNADEVISEPMIDQGDAASNASLLTAVSAGVSAQPQSLSTESTSQVPAPRVVSRAGWGQTRVPPIWRPSYAKLGGAVIHHTAGSNSYTASQAPSVVRGVHDYHTYSWGRGWDDVGYNFLIDRFGTIYEGRYGTLASTSGRMVVGGHAAPANTGSVGISVMGTYTGSVQPSAGAMTAMEDIIAWQFSRAGINPRGSWTFYNSRLGRNSTVPAVLGHKDVSATACPANIYPLLPSLRNSTAAKIDSAGQPVRGSNDLALFKTNDFSPTAGAVQYFGRSGDEIYVGNVLGKGDLPFIRRSSTFTFAEGPTSPTTTRSHVLGQAGQEVYSGDIDGTGREALILRNGNRFDIYGDLTKNTPTKSMNYGRADDEVFVFDWDGDGMDEIAVRRGNTFFLKWTVKSGYADREIDYGRDGDEVLVGRWSANPNETITVRRGHTYYMSYLNTSGAADKVFNYGRSTDRVVVGDWDRNGRDGLGVIRDLTK